MSVKNGKICQTGGVGSQSQSHCGIPQPVHCIFSKMYKGIAVQYYAKLLLLSESASLLQWINYLTTSFCSCGSVIGHIKKNIKKEMKC